MAPDLKGGLYGAVTLPDGTKINGKISHMIQLMLC